MACTAADTTAAALALAAAGPAKAQTDAGMAEQQPLSELIAAHRYLAGLCAGSGARRGLRITKLIPHGAADYGANTQT